MYLYIQLKNEHTDRKVAQNLAFKDCVYFTVQGSLGFHRPDTQTETLQKVTRHTRFFSILGHQ